MFTNSSPLVSLDLVVAVAALGAFGFDPAYHCASRHAKRRQLLAVVHPAGDDRPVRSPSRKETMTPARCAESTRRPSPGQPTAVTPVTSTNCSRSACLRDPRRTVPSPDRLVDVDFPAPGTDDHGGLHAVDGPAAACAGAGGSGRQRRRNRIRSRRSRRRPRPAHSSRWRGGGCRSGRSCRRRSNPPPHRSRGLPLLLGAGPLRPYGTAAGW
jgi:hypothetical protein